MKTAQFFQKFLIFSCLIINLSLIGKEFESNEEQEKTQLILEDYENELAKDPNNINLLEALADSYYSIKNYKRAATLFQRALDLNPNNQKVRISLALSYLFLNEIDKSYPLFKESLLIEPKNPDILFGLGRIAYFNHHVEEAMDYYQQALTINPNHLATLSSLGELKIQQKQYVEAQEIFEKISKLYPQQKWVKNSLEQAKNGPILEDIKLIEMEGDLESAMKLYQQFLAANPNFLDIYLLLGRLYTKVEQYNDAIALYQSGLELFPDSNSLKIGLGYAYLGQQKLAQGKNLFLEVLKLEPKNAEALAGLGRIAELKKDYRKAVEYYQKALKIDPYNISALIYLAELKLKQKQFNEAQKLFEQLLKLEPQTEWIKQVIEEAKYGPLLEEIKINNEDHKYAVVEELYKQILSQRPLNTDFYLGLGQLYINQKRYPEAVQVYLDGLKIQPKSNVLLIELGYAYLFNDETEKSKKIFKSVLGKEPKNASALAGLGHLAELDDHVKEANIFYQKALESDPDNITALSLMGNFKMAQKRYKEAEKVFEQIVHLLPKAKWAEQAVEEAKLGPLMEKIKLAEKERDFDYLETLYLQLIAEAPHYTDYYLRLGKLYEQTHRNPEAIELYFRGLEAQPDAYPLLVALGYIYLSQGDLELSYHLFHDALKLEPKNSEALAGLGRVAELSENLIEAEDLYQQALIYNPNNITSLSSMGSLKLKQKQYASAEHYYKKLQKLLPKEKWVQYGLRDARFGPLVEEIKQTQNVEGLQKNERLQRQLVTEKLYQQLLSQAPENADYYLGLGRLYAEMKRFSEAIRIYQRGLKIDPKSSVIHAAMGFSYLFKEDLDKASKEFHLALEYNPNDADALAGLGRIAEITGNLIESEMYYQNALDVDSRNITALSFMGALKMKQKQYAEAQAIYTKLKELNPNAGWVTQALEDIEVAPLLAEITNFEQNKDFDRAESLYFRVIAQVSDKTDYYLSLGNLYVRMKKYDKAIEVFEKGLQADFDSNQLHIALGIAYIHNKEIDKAKRELEIAYNKMPNNPEVLAGLGRIEALQGDLEQAESLYQQSLGIGPYNVSTLSFYGDLLMKQKRFDEAYRLYTTLIRLDPKASWARRALKNAEDGPILEWAKTLDSLGEWRLAKAQYISLIGSSPDNVDYYVLLGQIYLNQGKMDEAIEIFQRAVEIEPETKYLWKVLAFAYLSREDLCSAYEIFAWLVEEDPNDADVWAGLGRFYALKGNPCCAEKYYEHALEIDSNNMAALSNLALLKIDELHYFSALNLYHTMLSIQPQAKWVRQGFYDTAMKIRPHLYLEGRYHEEDEWDEDIREWVARYQVYGFNYWLNYPINDNFSTLIRTGNDYYELRDTNEHFTIYSFSVIRIANAMKLVLNPCLFVEMRLGLSQYSRFRCSSFREQNSFFIEPQFLLNYHKPKELAVLGFSSDLDLVARDFQTRVAKMVGRWFFIGRYEREIIKKGILGLEGIAYWYNDFVNNRSQRARAWIQWNPPKFSDHVALRYQFQYQRFDKVIPDYYTFKYQIINYLQIELFHSWCQTVYGSMGYGHGWQNTRTRFAQIIVVNPIETPTSFSFFTDRRQYNIVYGNLTYKEDPLEISLRADYYRDTEKYTMWSVIGTIGWRF